MSAKSADDFLEHVCEVARREGRYDLQAYLFVFQALDFTLRRLGEHRHVTGQELLAGIKDFALLNFGAMGKAVFNQWGVSATLDFGRIVFSLVESELMAKTEGDSLSDFEGGFDFETTFEKEYVPAGISEGEQPSEDVESS